jgi:hypothetical protein
MGPRSTEFLRLDIQKRRKLKNWSRRIEWEERDASFERIKGNKAREKYIFGNVVL